MRVMDELVLRSAADAAAALHHAACQVRAGEVAQCLAIAALCDLHRVDETVLVPGAERWVPGGADGTPRIGEFVVAEISALLGVSLGAAVLHVERVLNLRHRHPRLWRHVIEGEVRAFEAFRVADAAAAARLSADACARLDALCAQALALQPWARVKANLERWLLLADPEQAALNEAAAAERRYVHVGGVERGHTPVWAQLDAADGIALDDALTCLADDVPGDTVHHRRAAALGVLARHALGQAPLPTCTTAGVGAPASGATHAGAALGAADHPELGAGDPGPDGARGSGAAQAGTGGSLVPGAGDLGGVREGLSRKADLIVTLSADDLTDPEQGVASLDRWGHALLPRLRDLLAGHQIRVRPVVAGGDLPAVDGYQVPADMRLAIEARNPVDGFPWGTRNARSCHQDHTIPYDHTHAVGAGQTRLGNLAPLSSLAHRVKTHGGWHLEQPHPGLLVWRSPLGYEYAVTPAGTLRIGRPPPREHHWWRQEPPDDDGEPPPGVYDDPASLAGAPPDPGPRHLPLPYPG